MLGSRFVPRYLSTKSVTQFQAILRDAAVQVPRRMEQPRRGASRLRFWRFLLGEVWGTSGFLCKFGAEFT